MERKHLRTSVFLLALTLIIITIILFIPYKLALVFQYQNTGDILAYIPFSKDGSFKIKYTHSIHLSDVVESYRLTHKQNIQQYELMYEDFAIGMPANASEGEIFVQENGKYYIKNMNRVFPFFDLRIGQVRANHRIIHKNIEYPLSRYIEPGTWVRIKFQTINLLQQLKGENILE